MVNYSAVVLAVVAAVADAVVAVVAAVVAVVAAVLVTNLPYTFNSQATAHLRSGFLLFSTGAGLSAHIF
jgi:hypothetical protein